MQLRLFGEIEGKKEIFSPKRYLPFLSVTENKKGVLDVDTVKGCTEGMAKLILEKGNRLLVVGKRREG